MSKGINKVMLLGNVGKDPEIKYTVSGAAICNITVATSESWNDKQTGEKVEKTEWHRVVAFQKLAEIMGEHLSKGSQVFIEGKLQTRKWQDKDGQDKYTTEVVANNMLMLGSKVESKPEPNKQGFRKPVDARNEPTQDDFVDDSDVPF